MPNIIAELTARIEEYRATNKHPCKNYATEAAAEKAGAEMAQKLATYFDKFRSPNARPANYVVFKVEAWGRWVVCFDQSEVMRRPTSTGGYVGVAQGFFVW